MTFTEQITKLLVATNEVFPIAGGGNHGILLDSTGKPTLMTMVEHCIKDKPPVREFWRLSLDETLDWSDLGKDLREARADIIAKIEARFVAPSTASTLKEQSTAPVKA